jgi:hypothetical protein
MMTTSLSGKSTLLLTLASIFLISVSALPTIGESANTATPASATPSTGVKIGTVISDVIKTAFPEVQTVVNALFGNKPDNSKITKADATAAISDAKKKASLAAFEKLKPLSKLADELFTINEFVVPALRAQVDLATLTANLGSIPPKWPAIKTDWSTVNKQLSIMSEVKAADLSKVGNIAARIILQNIQANTGDAALRMQGAIDQRSVTDALAQASVIQSTLHDVATLSTVEFEQLRQDIADAGSSASGGEGGQEPPSMLTAGFRAELERKYPKAHF